MAILPNIVPREQAFGQLIRAVRRVAGAAASCPACGSAEVHRSRRRSFFDFVFACFFLLPFRCRACRARFLQVWRPAFKDPAESPMDLLTLLPRTWPEHPAPSMADPPADAQPVRLTRPRSILILESDPSIRKLLRRLLDRRGYFTYEVLKPEDLPAELRERRVDLLIIEDSLLDAAAAPVHSDLKILSLSLGPLNGAVIPGRSLALTKPFSSRMFIECVDRLLET